MPKAIIADDSITIQKIVKITLDQYVDLTVVDSSNQLFDLLSKDQADLVLLDYGLPDEQDGFGIAKKIKDKSAGTKVLMLFGTFDTIDFNRLKEYAIDGHLVKPFDGKELVALTQNLLQGKTENEIVNEPTKEENGFNNDESSLDSPQNQADDEADEWVVSAPEIVEETQESIEIPDEETLENEMKSWGVDLPPKLNAGVSQDRDTDTDEENLYPNENDLEFPNIEFSQNSISEDENGVSGNEEKEDFDEKVKLSSELILESDLNEDEEMPREENTGTFSFVPEIDLFEENHSLSIEKDIEDEVDSDKEWSIDEEEVVDNDATQEIDPPKLINEDTNTNINTNDNRREIGLAELKLLIDESVKRHCQHVLEKVAWEVIPTIAEDLIKRELEKLKEETLK